ncbi:hypothetical protein V7S43_002734 [Phytophthora oleae]|uniref:Uncharacterized protein n=1 Tax=Phytophthora oleae TaxID=2107226 RepID=A0ABD3G205_9STRA
MFGLLDVAQYVHGSIFSYNVYFRVMVLMLALAFVTYSRTRDTMVALIAMWFLCQLINREDSFEGDADAKETFGKLLEVAKVVMPVFPLVAAFDFALDRMVEARAEAESVGVIFFRSEEGHTRYGTM